MYTSFYGFHEKPFSLSPDPRYLFLAESHSEALAHLLYGIEHGEGFIAITGEVGTGKTTLSRTLLQRMPPGSEVAFILNPELSALDLLCAINEEFGLSAAGLSRREIHDQLNRFLLEQNQAGRRVLLIIDEAQNLQEHTLEQVRLLSNLETDTAKLLQIILLGQPELEAKLHTPELRQLRQRITVWWKLVPLSATETHEYVQHRLRIASGGERKIFSDAALAAIHRLSGGIPRLINVLCDRALLAAYAANVLEVDVEMVRCVERELVGHSALPWWKGWFRRFRSKIVNSKKSSTLLQGVFGSPIQIALAIAIVILGVSLGYTISRIESPPASLPAPSADVAALRSIEAPSLLPLHEEVADENFARVPFLKNEEAVSPSAKEDGPVSSVPFEQALAALAPGVSYANSVNAMLGLWEMAPLALGPLPLAGALLELEKQGLATLWLQKTSLQELRAINQPALLTFVGGDDALRMVVLKRLDAKLDGNAEGESAAAVAVLVGIDGATQWRVEWTELAQIWSGSAVIPWRDFEALPDFMKPGDRGDAANWLQSGLHGLGLYAPEPNGNYDAATASAVRAFQNQVNLKADGTVGTRTKLMLYGALPQYKIPKLRSTEDAG